MHDIIGNSGMLRGWISIWLMQMVWLFVAMVAAIGVTAVAELLHHSATRISTNEAEDGANPIV
jgi:hypothetical protein